jgi:hypothetical protein
MRINCNDFCVRKGDKVNLGTWPTNIEPVYSSKKDYHESLAEHVSQLSALQQLLYASNHIPADFETLGLPSHELERQSPGISVLRTCRAGSRSPWMLHCSWRAIPAC